MWMRWIRRFLGTARSGSDALGIKPRSLKQAFQNPYGRFEPSSKMVSHVLLTTRQATHYPLPMESSTTVPEILPIQTLFIQHKAVKANTPSGLVLSSRRAVKIEIQDSSTETPARVLFFSPERRKKSNQQIPVVGKASLALQAIYPDANQKGGYWVQLDRDSIEKRKKMKRRPSQKQVMGNRSAKMAYQAVLRELNPNTVPPLLYNNVHQLAEAQTKSEQAEWTHLYGFRLLPLPHDPQVPSNLMAGPAFFNSSMLVFERLAEFFVYHLPEDKSAVHLWTAFTTFQDSDIIHTAEFRVKIQYQHQQVTLYQHYDLSLPAHPGPKASDLAQLTWMLAHVLDSKPGDTVGMLQHSVEHMDQAVFNLNQLVDQPLAINCNLVSHDRWEAKKQVSRIRKGKP